MYDKAGVKASPKSLLPSDMCFACFACFACSASLTSVPPHPNTHLGGRTDHHAIVVPDDPVQLLHGQVCLHVGLMSSLLEDIDAHLSHPVPPRTRASPSSFASSSPRKWNQAHEIPLIGHKQSTRSSPYQPMQRLRSLQVVTPPRGPRIKSSNTSSIRRTLRSAIAADCFAQPIARFVHILLAE